jgi:hypothetical protein
MKPRSSRLLWNILFSLAIASIIVIGGILGLMFALGGMAKVAAWYLFQIIPPALGLLSLILVCVNFFVTRRFARMALITVIISLGAISPALLMLIPMTYPASIEAMTPSATVRLPAEIPLKVAWGGDNVKVNQHAMVPDQRWAYDFVVDPYAHGSANLEDYGIYGIPIVAPASGEVAVAHDGEPDMKPGALSNNIEAPCGNYIAIRIPTQTYLIIAHLKPGSLLVKEGDQVKEGQKIAECGNSGNTSEPHIHIHHQRQNPKDYPVNFAEGLPLFFRDHDGPPMPVGGVKIEKGATILVGPTVQHVSK